MHVQQSVFLITGGSRGLGFELAREVVRQGGEVVLVARHPDEVRGAVQQLGGRVLPMVADVGEDAERIVQTALRHHGRIDVLVNNASELGPSPMPALAHYPWQALERVLRTNVLAPLHLTQLVLPAMQARGRGLIVNVTSDAAVQAYPGWGGYGLSKAALEHQSQTLGQELVGSGVRVLLVDPGDMNTRMHELAEPGVDLSGLPSPDRVALALLQAIEQAAGPFARVQLQQAVGV